jgi:hypothetical protein
MGIPHGLIDRILNWLPHNVNGLPQGYELSDAIAALVLTSTQREIKRYGIDCFWLNDLFICARTYLEAGNQLAQIVEVLEKEDNFALGFKKTEFSSGINAAIGNHLGCRGDIDFNVYFDENPLEGLELSEIEHPYAIARTSSRRIDPRYALNWERLIRDEYLAKYGESEGVLRQAIRCSRTSFVEEWSDEISCKYPTLIPTLIRCQHDGRQKEFAIKVLSLSTGPWTDGRLIEFLSTIKRLNNDASESSQLIKTLMNLSCSPVSEAAINCALGDLNNSRLAMRVAVKLGEDCLPELRISRLRAVRGLETHVRRDCYHAVEGKDPILDAFVAREKAYAA